MKITVTPEDFKAQFPRFRPVYLPIYVNQTYTQGERVYYNNTFYQVKVASTNNIPTNTTDWEVVNDNVLNYTQDSDIINAIAEASVNFNENLFPDCCTAKLVFLYLVAYYLTVDFQNALNPMSAGGIVTNKSVGSVSEGYAIPTAFINNPKFGLYAKNGYGQKYLSLILPYLTGNIIISYGATTTN